MDKYSYIANAHGNYIEELYNDYNANPESVDVSWQKFFEGFDFAQANFGENGDSGGSVDDKEIKVHYLIHAYRSRAHLREETNPLRTRKDRGPILDLEEFDLSKAYLKLNYQPRTIEESLDLLFE